jgi:oligopeptide transport system substrate-binding protein
MKVKLSSWPVVLVGIAAISIFAGCGKGGGGGFSSRTAAAESNVLRYAIPTNPTTLDPAIVQDGDTIDLLQQMYESLVGWNEKNEVIGLLAESWTVSPDAKVFTFKMRPGVKFQNGREVEAEDVKWSIERACSPALKSTTCTAYLGDVVGIQEVADGKTKEVSGIEVLDKGSIRFTLKQPAPYFLGKLTYLVSAALPKEVVPADRQLNKAEEAVGTGPYKLAKYEDKQLAVLEPFADYWGGKPILTKIERPVIIDADLRLTKFRNGELDILLMQRQDLAGVETDAKLKPMISYQDRAAIYYIGMNEIKYAPFKDKRVRQAFTMAVDRDKITKELLGGVYPTAETIVPPGIPGHRDKGKGFSFNVAEAKKLLAEAGYPDGKGMPELDISFQQGKPDIKTVAEAVAGMIKANLGVEVRAQPMEWGKYLEEYNNKNQVFYHMRWSADFYDMQNFLSHMLTTNGPENKFGYSNPEYDRLCHLADTTVEMDQRIPLYQQAEDIVLEDAAWIPIYYQRDVVLVNPQVSGLRLGLGGYLPHTTTTVTR